MSKKFNISNPANKFINTDNTDNTSNTDNGSNTEHTETETKSKRLNLLVKPSVLDNFKKIATMEQTSVNDLINQIMEDHIEKEAEKIKLYDSVFKAKD